ncbi:MAG: hypothetical protein KatS3mg108_2009 [Isosphaeraceae bacterium]|jgi:Ca2+-binding EF-hand superfamily protein|nr:MAG: hypothetical protein KatS3mg108_2009 [Isosphaeraceae bacterium]
MRLVIWMAAASSLGLLSSTTWAQEPIVDRLRSAVEQLDANADGVLERSEIPEEGLPAFDRLLRRGDTNNDGKLDTPELRSLGERVRGLAGMAGAGGQRLRTMDANQDGKVSRDEFRGPAALFDRLDADKDGVLSGDELRPARPGATRPGDRPAGPPVGRPGGPPASRPDAGPNAPGPRRLANLDQNGDGKISRDEFRGPAALFDRLDADKDGVLSGDELRPARPGATRPGDRPAGPPVGRPGGPPASRPDAGPNAPGPRRLANLDQNGDGKISRDEFRGPAGLFDRLDTNGDGVLDQADRPLGPGRPRPDRPNRRPAGPDA